MSSVYNIAIMSVYTTSTIGTITLYSFLYGTDVITFDRNITADILVVGGGGGGGLGYMSESGGGGGGGEMKFGTASFVANTPYYITVGKGGAGGWQDPLLLSDYSPEEGKNIYSAHKGLNGEDSKLIGGSITAVSFGGGGGGSANSNYSNFLNGRVGSNGGSGGGGSYAWTGPQAGGSAISGSSVGITSPSSYVNIGGTSNGYVGGGGGGAGAQGGTGSSTDNGNGGNGAIWSVNSTYYAGGGGAGNQNGSRSAGVGGTGGGGAGGSNNSPSGIDGSANTGGGGGGSRGLTGAGYVTDNNFAGYANGKGGDGGSGIVIIAFTTSLNPTITLTGTGPGRTNVVRADHLYWYYPFNGNFNDYSSGTAISNLKMNYVELSTSQKKLSNASAHFKGIAEQNITLPNITFTGSGFTIQFWLYISSYTENARIFDFGKDTIGNNIMLYLNSGKYTLKVYQTTDVSFTQQLTDVTQNSWTHLCLIMDPVNPCTIKWYVNGVLNAYTNAARARYVFTFEFTKCYLGKGSTDQSPIDVYMNNFMVFHRALHDAEVQVLYSSPTSFNLVYNTIPSNTININNNRLLCYYPFNTDLKNAYPEMGVADVITSSADISNGDTVAGTGSFYKTGTQGTNTNSYGKLPNIKYGPHGITISFWAKSPNIKVDVNGSGGRFLDLAPNRELGIVIYTYNSGKLCFYQANGITYRSTHDEVTSFVTYPNTNWHHYCVTIEPHSGGQYANNTCVVTYYLDFVQLFRKTDFKGYPYTHLNPNYSGIGDTFYIGYSNWNEPTSQFNMFMNNLIIYGRVLSLDEIRYLYSTPSSASITFTSNPTTPFIPDTYPYKINSISTGAPTGALMAYSGTADPDGWVICDGQPRFAADGRYAELLAMGIGTAVLNVYTPPNYNTSTFRGTGSSVYNQNTYTGPTNLGQPQFVETSASSSAFVNCISINWIIKL